MSMAVLLAACNRAENEFAVWHIEHAAANDRRAYLAANRATRGRIRHVAGHAAQAAVGIAHIAKVIGASRQPGARELKNPRPNAAANGYRGLRAKRGRGMLARTRQTVK